MVKKKKGYDMGSGYENYLKSEEIDQAIAKRERITLIVKFMKLHNLNSFQVLEALEVLEEERQLQIKVSSYGDAVAELETLRRQYREIFDE